MAGSFYFPIFIHIVMVASFYYFIQLTGKSQLKLLKGKNEIMLTISIGIILTFVMGLRPITHVFGDTMSYAQGYYALQQGLIEFDANGKELLFNWLMASCAKVMDVSYFFLIIEFGYIGCLLWAIKRLLHRNMLLAFLFCIGAFSFFTFGTNGIRNGLSTSIIILAMTYINGLVWQKVFSVLLLFLAFNIHSSVILPICAILLSSFYNNTKVYILFWISAIFISLVAGGIVENIFLDWGFDDRMDKYITNDEFNDQFSSIGFRWDFLIYSMMPIILGYYCVLKKKVFDWNYLLLLNTYIICNSIWVMLIRASFSNRFAYLSWFLYPVVLAYPLLRLPIWKDQGKKVGIILFVHTLFTYMMWLIKG